MLNVNTTGPVAVFYIFTVIAHISTIATPELLLQPSPVSDPEGAREEVQGLGFQSNGTLRTVSSNIAEGQDHLVMEETEERKDQDERAIRWLADGLTEMDSFATAIPVTFTTQWGVEVWKKVSKAMEEPPLVPPPVQTSSQLSWPSSTHCQHAHYD